jgi:hypothetical protein
LGFSHAATVLTRKATALEKLYEKLAKSSKFPGPPRRGFKPLKTNLLADRSEVGLWQMTVSPTCNAQCSPNAIFQIVGLTRNYDKRHAASPDSARS